MKREYIKTAEEIILKYCETKTNDYGTFFKTIGEEQYKKSMIEYANQFIDLAAEEAESKIIYSGEEYNEFYSVVIEQSILNIKELIK